MANSKIVIEFYDVPPINAVISFAEVTAGVNVTETVKQNRLAANQVKRPNFQADDGIHPDRYFGFISTNFKNAFNLDYNWANQFTVLWTEGPEDSGIGTVTIEANYPNAVFTAGPSTPYVHYTVTNTTTVPAFDITAVDFQTSSIDPCERVNVSVTTNGLATQIIGPVPVNPNTDNPFTFDYPRAQTFEIIVKDAAGSIRSQWVTTPALLNAANFNLQIANSPYGATVTVNQTNSAGLNLEYSLDNSTWQSSNVFSGLDLGQFKVYVRDQFGCRFFIGFEVVDTGIYSPFFYISKANSLRFAQRVDFASNPKTDENTLSCEVDAEVVYKEIQKLCTADTVTTQFKSNFASNVAKVIKPDGSFDMVTVEKKTDHIGKRDLRDAIKYDYDGTRSGIYFISGNIYDYVTAAVVEPYALNGYLPVWGKAGNYIRIDGTWLLIEEVVFDELKNAEVLIVNANHSGVPQSIVVGSIFNLHEFELYEFAIDMLPYLGMQVRIQIEASDANFPGIVHLSEVISVAVAHPKTIDIRYWNSTNTDVWYATDVRFQLRQEIINMGGASDQEQQSLKTDTNVRLLSGQAYEVDQIEFEPVTKEIMRKLVIALSHEFVFINGVGYVKDDSVDIEQLEHTNLYTVKAKMSKTGNVYSSITSGSTNIYNGGTLNIPGLVDFGGGFVKY